MKKFRIEYFDKDNKKKSVLVEAINESVAVYNFTSENSDNVFWALYNDLGCPCDFYDRVWREDSSYCVACKKTHP